MKRTLTKNVGLELSPPRKHLMQQTQVNPVTLEGIDTYVAPNLKLTLDKNTLAQVKALAHRAYVSPQMLAECLLSLCVSHLVEAEDDDLRQHVYDAIALEQDNRRQAANAKGGDAIA